MDHTEKMNSQEFEYSYSAKKQQEIEKIRNKYVMYEDQDTILDQIKKLDGQAEKRAAIPSIWLGGIGCLLMGLGMCGTLVVGTGIWFVLGIIVGVIGIIMMVVSYPLYARRIVKERKQIAPEILKLSGQKEE